MPRPTRLPLAPTSLIIAACSASVLLPGIARADDGDVRAATCPMDVPGTSIVARPIRDGAAVLFLSPQHAAELRRRVRALSSVQNKGAVTPPATAPLTRAAEAAPFAQPHEPAAMVYDVHGGAVLTFKPSRLDQISDVQARALQYAQRMAGGECPLLRDPTKVLRTATSKAKQGTAGQAQQLPPGVVPGVGSIADAAVIVPSLVF